MRKLLFIICILSLSSCSLFKASTKKKSNSDSLTESSKTKSVTDIDTSKSEYKRKWKITFQPNVSDQPQLPGYQAPFIFSDLGTDEMKNAMQKLQKSYSLLAGKKNIDTNSVFNHGYTLASIEMEELMNAQLGKILHKEEKDTSTNHIQKNENNTEKQPINPWLVLGCVVIVAFTAYIIIKK